MSSYDCFRTQRERCVQNIIMHKLAPLLLLATALVQGSQGARLQAFPTPLVPHTSAPTASPQPSRKLPSTPSLAPKLSPSPTLAPSRLPDATPTPAPTAYVHTDTIARLRAEPLFVEHKLCAGCRANSWRGEVLFGASIYSELDAFGGLVIVPGAAVIHDLRYIQFCILSADTQLTLSLRLQSEVFGHKLSTFVVIQPLRDVEQQQQSSAKGLMEIVHNQSTAPLGACPNRTDTGAAWVMVRVNARAFALHREKVTNQSLSEELLEAEEADEPQAEPTTAPTTQPLELGGKRDVLEDLLLAPTSRSSSIVEVAELPGVVASGPAPLRGQTAQRMEEYGAEDLPPLWDRVAWVNRVNRSLSGFMLNNVVALVDPAPPLRVLTHGLGRTACHKGTPVLHLVNGSQVVESLVLPLVECAQACMLSRNTGCTAFNYDHNSSTCNLLKCPSYETRRSLEHEQTYIVLPNQVEVCAVYDQAVTGPGGSSPACDVALGLSQPQDDSANRTGIASDLVIDVVDSPAEDDDALLVVNGKELENGELFMALVGSSMLIVLVALVFFAKQRRAHPARPHNSIFSREPSPDTEAVLRSLSRRSMSVEREQPGVAPSPCGATEPKQHDDEAPRRSQSMQDFWHTIGHVESFIRDGTPLRKHHHILDFETEVKLLERIGSGAFGDVYRGLFQGEEVAVKMFGGRLHSAEATATFEREAGLLSWLDCSHIVGFKAACLLPPHLCIVTELCTRGSLYDALYGPTPHRRIKTFKDILHTARQISAAMAYLHPVIVHRDLKPANVLMTEHGVKVADFGLSRYKGMESHLQTHGIRDGTVSYMAPELFNNKKKATEKADCYSFGCLLWELLAGKVPWAGFTVWQIIMIVESDTYQGLPEDDSWPRRLRELITHCMRINPNERPCFLSITQELVCLLGEFEAEGILNDVPTPIANDVFDDLERFMPKLTPPRTVFSPTLQHERRSAEKLGSSEKHRRAHDKAAHSGVSRVRRRLGFREGPRARGGSTAEASSGIAHSPLLSCDVACATVAQPGEEPTTDPSPTLSSLSSSRSSSPSPPLPPVPYTSPEVPARTIRHRPDRHIEEQQERAESLDDEAQSESSHVESLEIHPETRWRQNDSSEGSLGGDSD